MASLIIQENTLTNGMRNNIFIEEDIGEKYTLNELHNKVSARDYQGLHIGNYFDVDINTRFAGSETVRCTIAAFDYYRYTGGSGKALSTGHIVIVPKNCFATTSYMNSSNTTAGGYMGSYMYTDVLPVYQEALESVFGDYMIEWNDYLTNAIDTSYASMAGCGFTGASSAGEWADIKLRLMNEAMLYGCHPNSSSRYDIMVENSQLPLFRLNNRAKITCLGGTGNPGTRQGYWLSAVTSSSRFASCASNGYANTSTASDAHGVRPFFLFS